MFYVCGLFSLTSPPCDVLDEEDEGDAESDESDGHGGDHQLLEAAEELLRSRVVEVGVVGGVLQG